MRFRFDGAMFKGTHITAPTQLQEQSASLLQEDRISLERQASDAAESVNLDEAATRSLINAQLSLGRDRQARRHGAARPLQARALGFGAGAQCRESGGVGATRRRAGREGPRYFRRPNQSTSDDDGHPL